MISDLALMRIRADTLFTYDTRGRMLNSNELDGRPAPRLFLGCTAAGYVARFGSELSDAIVRRLTEIIDGLAPITATSGLQVSLEPLQVELTCGAPNSSEGGGPAYRFPEVVVNPGDAVQVTEGNLELVLDSFPWLLNELPHWSPCFAVVRDRAAVSICFSSRIGREAAEAGVETIPEYRGRGFAGIVTAAWGASIHASGRIPFYSTWWDNLASQAVARRLGLVTFGFDVTWT